MKVSDFRVKKQPSFYEQARDTAVAAARAAARVIQARAGGIRAENIRSKATHDLVTDVDEAAQETIIEVLRDAYPQHAILAEEGAAEAAAEAADGFRWIIDPIDGTTNFAHGVPPYAVSIGLQEGERVVVGVVLDVSRDELFTAVRGGGLFVNGVRAQVSDAATLDASLVTTGFPYRELAHLEPYLAVLGTFMRRTRGVRRPGSASVDLAYVACGRFDGFFETGLKAWDVAAGMLLVEEGGGRVTDYRDVPDRLFAGQVLATNGRVHEAMLEVLQPMRDVRG